MLPSLCPPEVGRVEEKFFRWSLHRTDGRVERFGFDRSALERRLDELAPEKSQRLKELDSNTWYRGDSDPDTVPEAELGPEYVEAEEVDDPPAIRFRPRNELPPPSSVPVVASFSDQVTGVDERFSAHDRSCLDEDMSHRRPGHVFGLDGA